MKKNDGIEKLFREQFEGYRVTPSEGLWGRVVRQLRWREFLHFSPGQFNVWYLAAVLTVTIGAYLGLSDRGDTPEKVSVPVSAVSIPHTQTVTRNTGEERESVFHAGAADTSSSVRNEKQAASGEVTQQQSHPDRQPVENTLAEDDAVTATTKGTSTTPKEKESPPPVETKEKEDLLPVPVRQEKLAPVARFELSADHGCPPLRVRFMNFSKYASRFVWNIMPGNITLTNASPEYVFDEPGTYVIRLTAGDDTDRSSVYTDTVEVYASPRAQFDYSPREAVVPDDEIFFYNSSLEANRYLWSFGDGHTSQESDPVHRYTTDGPFEVKLTVWSSQGCVDSVVLRNMFENTSYYIRFPNAFIANTNGPSGGYYSEGSLSNDVFHPVWKGVVDYHLQIFNRRGELVFESKDLHRGWDGYILDQLATPGVYIWKARGTFSNGKPFVRFGNVTLIKKQ
jgi:PKD repeat protein